MTCLWVAFQPLVSHAQTPPDAQEARSRFHHAQVAVRANPTNAVAHWELARAAFDLAETSGDNHDRRDAAEAGIAAAREAISLEPDSAPAHYYLALNLGQKARARRLAALRLLREMEQALLTAARLNSDFDYAGPDRSLGMLYLQAPPWPASVGSRAKARAHLERAVQLAPDYPDNRIALAEAFARWREIKGLERELKLVEEGLPKVRARLAGDLWKPTWKDWDARIRKLHDTRDQLLANPWYGPGERGAMPVK